MGDKLQRQPPNRPLPSLPVTMVPNSGGNQDLYIQSPTYLQLTESEYVDMTKTSRGQPCVRISTAAAGTKDTFVLTSPAQQQYYVRFPDKLREVAKELKHPSDFSISTFDTAECSAIKVIHHAADMNQVHPAILAMIQKLSEMYKPMPGPGMRRFLRTHTGRKDVRVIEEKYKIVVLAGSNSSVAFAGGGYHGRKITTREKFEINLVTNVSMLDWVQNEVDVFVNGIKKDGDLSSTETSRNLTDRAGKPLKLEFDRKMKDRPKQTFIITKQFQLKCKKVFHILCPIWDSGSGSSVKAMRQLVRQCLVEANNNHMRSLAFSALGVGELGYPPNVMANILVSEVVQFSTEYTGTTVCQVLIFPTPSRKDLGRDFEMAFEDLAKSISSSLGEAERSAKSDVTFPFRLPAPGDASILVHRGPAADQQADVIVNPVCTSPAGWPSSKLLETAGKHVQAECRALRPRGVKPGEMLETTSGNLACKKLYHASCPVWNRKEDTIKQICEETLTACMTSASINNFTSLMIPAFEASLGYPHSFTANFLLQFFMDFYKANPGTSVGTIHIVVSEPETLKAFKHQLTVMRDATGPSTSQEEGLCFCGPRKDDFDKAYQELADLYLIRKKEKPLQDHDINMFIPFLEDAQLEELRGIEEQHCVVVRVCRSPGAEQIIVEGYDDTGIQAAMSDIKAALGEVIGISAASQPPKDWDPMPSETSFKIVTVKSSSSEYKTLAADITRSKGPKTIVKIERIQNKSVWMKYLQKKATMTVSEQRELVLYHGTTPESADNISYRGFSERVSKQQVIFFGQGTYFSKSAEYWMRPTLTPPDDTRCRYMFVCTVLVGTYTQGDETMFEPPAPYVTTVDTLANPQVFVTYRDNQAYPNYRVTFK